MLLFILPESAVPYLITHSLSQGRMAGLVCRWPPIHVGSIVHMIAAAVGLSGVIAASSDGLSAWSSLR